MRISRFKFDNRAVVEGKWFDGPDGGRFLIARAGNPNYRAHLERATRDIQKTLRVAKLDDATIEAKLRAAEIEAVAEHVLKGWEKITDDKDQPIEYSPETAARIFTEMPDFFNLVMQYAQDLEQFRVEAQREREGNS